MVFRARKSLRLVAAAGAAATPSFAVGPGAAAAAAKPTRTPTTKTITTPPLVVEGLTLSFGQRMVVSLRPPNNGRSEKPQSK